MKFAYVDESGSTQGGEQAFYTALVSELDAKREQLGRTPDAECADFYNAAKHPAWVL